jgi:hypothetical protein
MNIHEQHKSSNLCHNSTDGNSNSLTAPYQSNGCSKNNSCKGTKRNNSFLNSTKQNNTFVSAPNEKNIITAPWEKIH